MVRVWKARLSEYLRDILVNYDMCLKFFLITNDQINAVFLARYIAKKLVYHHKLKWLLNPLKKEFKAVGRYGKSRSSTKNLNPINFFKCLNYIGILYYYVLLKNMMKF